ncbi:MAG TPA: phosphoribosylaminoimidazolesuccinocarboxamide synthase [Bryobacteraceae bacterium]|jgi:phosphoribosylaminoimidazole-succinocarboxamide synthase|nr:phosphoribosylaminoimidazolesuccinocarboxamide synthase [Bryobacteraceae bacterium]
MASCEDQVLLETDLSPLPLYMRGKVRDIYDLGDCFLLVATDRISAFDCVLASGIPCKGRVLTQMSLFWFDFLSDLVPSHVLESDVATFPHVLAENREILKDRSMLVVKAEMIPVECVARGYLAGSAIKEYQATGAICGIPLSPGLREGDRLPEPIFTPATKSKSGHDENVPFKQIEEQIGSKVAAQVRDLTLEIYNRASEYALGHGIILADTKLEFGFAVDKLILADEVLTPDSSRYWPADSYHPGGPQPSFDKQYVRDFLETLDWDKRPPAPALPPEVIRKTTEKYLDAYERLTGRSL